MRLFPHFESIKIASLINYTDEKKWYKKWISKAYG